MPFPRRTIAFAKPSNARSVQDQVTWLSNVLTDHSVQFANLDLTPSSSVNITCLIAERQHPYARSSLGIHTLVRTSDIPTGTKITIDHDHRIDDAGTTITVAMTAVIAIAMTRTKIMIGMMTIGMTGMIDETHATIGETATEARATIEGITTTADGILLKMTRITPTRLGPTHQHTRRGTNRNLSHTQSGLTPATRPPLPVSSATNQGTTPHNAQQQTVERRPL